MTIISHHPAMTRFKQTIFGLKFFLVIAVACIGSPHAPRSQRSFQHLVHTETHGDRTSVPSALCCERHQSTTFFLQQHLERTQPPGGASSISLSFDSSALAAGPPKTLPHQRSSVFGDSAASDVETLPFGKLQVLFRSIASAFHVSFPIVVFTPPHP